MITRKVAIQKLKSVYGINNPSEREIDQVLKNFVASTGIGIEIIRSKMKSMSKEERAAKFHGRWNRPW